MNSSKQIEINVFSSEYQEDVIDLIVNIQQKEFGIAITANDQPDLHDIPGVYQKDHGNFWVAVMNKKVVGTIALLDIGNEQAALRKMFVNKTYRGPKFKVASMLLETLFDWGRSAGLKEIYLGTTPQFIAAHRFYEKNGFEEISKESLPTAFPIMSVDTKFYKYEL
jgi:GNAT superfamily N-acetyltransferase